MRICFIINLFLVSTLLSGCLKTVPAKPTEPVLRTPVTETTPVAASETKTTTANDTTEQLADAETALERQRPGEVRHIIANLPLTAFDQDQQIVAYTLSAKAYLQLNNPTASLQQRLLLDPLLSNDSSTQQHNRLAIWETLSSQSKDMLHRMLTSNTDTTWQAWVRLALLVRQDKHHPEQLAKHLRAWRAQSPNHPANALLAQDLTLTWQAPSHVALLLPLSGPLQKAGEAIRNGFIAQTYQVPASQRPAIDVFDTQTTDIASLYQTAINQGAQAIIGPLDKNKLKNLLDQQDDFPVPLLALNDLNQTSLPTNVYTFGLSPLDEAKQLSQKLWQEHDKHVALIYPSTDWGSRVSEGFLNSWQPLGGDVTFQWAFKPKANFNFMVANLLRVNASQQRYAALKHNLSRRHLGFIPRRRQDLDAIALIASPAVTRQIMPYLRFYYATDLPVFSTSFSYAGTVDPTLNRDMNGLHFCDMPWILDHRYLKQKKSLQQIWPQSFDRYPRLYALGTDAYQLTVGNLLPSLRLLPGLPFREATGRLLLANQQVHRYLQWAIIRQGRPHHMTS